MKYPNAFQHLLASRKLLGSHSLADINLLKAESIVLGAEGEMGEGLVREAGEQKGL